jgi:osmoprotectant transport system ATP-binding protein
LDVADGETLVLLGSSGSGKTTTLKMINRLIEPTAGSVEIGDQDASRLSPIDLRRSIGYVFQGIGLFPHFSVERNVSIIPRLLGWDGHRCRQSARELLELIGLDPMTYADRYPDELSGGEQQRVGVARALAADPEYLLMDEPFGALDAVTRDALQTELLTWKRQLGKTILFVTHDIFEALTLGDRIGVMHQGRLEQVGAPEELLHEPASVFVRDLFAKPAQQLAAFRDLL